MSTPVYPQLQMAAAAGVLGPSHQCLVCGLPYWIERTCAGGYDHSTGKPLRHEPVTVVPIRTAPGPGGWE